MKFRNKLFIGTGALITTFFATYTIFLYTNQTSRTITNYVENAFFEKNLDFELIELKITKRENLTVDSLLTIVQKANRIRISNKLESDFPNLNFDIWMEKFQDSINRNLKENKLNILRKSFQSNEIGQRVQIFLKGKISDKFGNINNFLWENTVFSIDNKNVIIAADLDNYLQQFK